MNTEDRAETRKPRRIMPALYMICRPAFAAGVPRARLPPRLPARRGRRGVIIVVIVAEQPAQQAAAMMALGLLLFVRRQVWWAAQAFVVVAIPAFSGRHQLLLFRRRLLRL